jgi:hypothetical protein
VFHSGKLWPYYYTSLKYLSGTNTLAYFDVASVAKEVDFMILKTEACTLKLYEVVITVSPPPGSPKNIFASKDGLSLVRVGSKPRPYVLD